MQQIVKGSLQVTVEGILRHVTVERRHLGGNLARQWLLTAERHVVLYCVKKSMGESVAILPQNWKIHC